MKKRIGAAIIGVICSSTAVSSLLLGAQNNPATPSLTRPVLHSPIAPTPLATPPPLAREDHEIFQHLMHRAIGEQLHRRSFPEVIQTLAEQFLRTPYQENLLDYSPQETLVTSLRQFDCVLFIETVLALTRGVVRQDYAPQNFADRLQEQRYTSSQIKGYCSRLHYFSDWVQDNQRRGLVIDITDRLGGIPMHKSLNFMSTHWQRYPQLAKNHATRQCISQMETRLETTLQARPLQYVPTAEIAKISAQLQPGDVIAVATRIPGLDVTHTGLAYRSSQGKMGLIHAASGGVKISPNLSTYIAQVDQAIGIIVIRPVDPRHSDPNRDLQTEPVN